MTGLLDVTADAYHEDQVADRPTLSASIAHKLLTQSPAHARAAHPRLNPAFERVEEERFELGRSVHALLLEGKQADVLPYDDYRTKAAKEARDEARAYGRIPMLVSQWDEVLAMVQAVKPQFEKFDPPLFSEGRAEQTIVWEDAGVLCRARLDWLRDDLACIDDLKTTRASANPEAWTRTLFGIGADVQCAMYLRGLDKALGPEPVIWQEPRFRFCVAETTAPYAMSVVSLAPSALALANQKVDRALAIWKDCLERDEWPAYPTEVAYAEVPPWMEYAWLEREAREAA